MFCFRRARQKHRQPSARFLDRRPCLETLESRSLLTTYTVTTPLDVSDPHDGVMSLREAIEASNASQNVKDTIVFAIPGVGPHTIQPLSGLPSITDSVVIDGYTQPGADENTNPPDMGTNAVLTIELNGSLIDEEPNAEPNGLSLVAGDSVVRGLAINGFEGGNLFGFSAGIQVGSSNNVIEGNFIGTDVTGSVALPNERGIELRSTGVNNRIGGTEPAARNVISGNIGIGVVVRQNQEATIQGNLIGTDADGTGAVGNNLGIGFSAVDLTIGGTTDAARNVISGNRGDGVLLSFSSNHVVQGNYIGTDVSGTQALGNESDGLVLWSYSNATQVGGTVPGAGNVISGNGTHNIVALSSSDHVIQGNFIGTDKSGTNLLGNSQTGISINAASGMLVGGNHSSARNIIAGHVNGIHIEREANDNSVVKNTIHSNGTGISVRLNSTGNSLRANSIRSSVGLGIDLDAPGVAANDEGDGDVGPNGIQNYPVLTLSEDGNSTRVVGTLNSLANREFDLDFFANAVVSASGHGEGERHLGSHRVTTDAFGNANFDVILLGGSTAGEFVSATATGPDGTSEFSGVRIVEPFNASPVIDNVNVSPIPENSSAGTVVGQVIATDADGDALSYSIADSRFEIDSLGNITVASGASLDFESEPSIPTTVSVTDPDGAVAIQETAITLLNQASITGTVFVDANENGQFDANEVGINSVTIQLLDQNGILLSETATTSGGYYLFEDLDPGTYQLHELQPNGVDDGNEHLGSLGGVLVSNDTMQLELHRTDAADYIFAELGQQVSSGDTATIGFWQNKHGQNLIREGGTQLAAWLSGNFDNVFGNQLDGASGDGVAAFYKDMLFKQKSSNSIAVKVDAQFMAVALATYFTSSNYAGDVATAYGFNVTDTGIGTKLVNVNGNGSAFNVDDNTNWTIMQLLLATNSLTDLPDGLDGFASIYDQNGDGVIDTPESASRAMANEVYTDINEGGDV